MLAARIVLVFFVVATLRFVYIQFIQSDKLQAEIIENRVREIVNLPERGTITDRKGNIMAMSIISYDVAVNPNLIVSEKSRDKVSKVLSENIEGIKYDDVMAILKSGAKYKVVGKRVPPDKVKKIKESGLGGIQISQSPKRIYPNDSVGSTILGFVNNLNEPGAGLEIKMNEFLAGKTGYTLAEINPFGKVIPVGSQNSISPVDGQNVNLTVDSYIQHVLEEGIAKRAAELTPKEIHAVIMNPQNGEILAMASYPTFNPNEYQKSDPKTWTSTPATTTYEPGSIMKPIFMAAALNYGTLKGDEKYPSGVTFVNGTRIKDWNNGGGWGVIGLKDIIRYSSNVGMINIQKTMTNQQIVDLFKNAGFGKATGIELPGEEIGVNFPTVKSLDDDPVRVANVSFGQGISVTPIQMITAFSQVINGGLKVKPHLVKEVTDNEGNVIFKPELPQNERIYSEHAAELVRSFLKYNMDEGSVVKAKVPGYDGGGKTGTAWFVENGVYAKGKIYGSFIGFMPYDKPKYAVLISIKEPHGVQYGSEAAIPVFHDIMKEIVRYDGLKPTDTRDMEESDKKKSEDTTPAVTFDVPDYTWMLYQDAVQAATDKFGDKVVVTQNGKGEVVQEQSYVYKGGKLNLILTTRPIVDGNTFNIPSFIGKTQAEIEQILKPYPLKYLYHGKTRVTEQTSKPGRYYKLDNIQFWSN